MEHICIDLETLSTDTNAAIVTLAAVKFSFKNNETENFCVNINPQDSVSRGLVVSSDTLEWWKKQPSEARDAWRHSRITLPEALDLFDEFCTKDSKNIIFWAKGAYFDFPILESSYRAVGKVYPHKYWNVMDMRTAYYLANFDTRDKPRIGSYHSGLDDCLTQVAHLKECLGINVL